MKISLTRLFAPRLTYRLRHGRWCDHQSYRYQSWVDHVDADAARARGMSEAYLAEQFPPDLGWDTGHLIDMGQAKLYVCQRCGYAESDLGHPVRDRLRELLGMPPRRNRPVGPDRKDLP